MPMRLASLAELLPNLPCKQEVNGRKLLLAFENGEIVAKEVVLEAAWQLKLEGLMKLKNDASIFKIIRTEMQEESVNGATCGVVWLTDEVIHVAPTVVPEKKLGTAGFGLGHHFKNFATSTSHPSVPEPWGGFEPAQPMLPAYAAGGIEHARVHGRQSGAHVPQLSGQMKQCTIQQAFKIQPMDY